MTPKRILLLSIALLLFEGIFYSLAGDFVVSDLFGNDPQVIESGSIFLKFLGTHAIVLAFIFFLLKNEKTIIIKKLLLGGGVLVLLQLINLFIYIQSIPIEILFSTIFLFLLFVYGYLKKA
ncbi:hypothetical protein N9877_03555 [Flavobacteriaceae bacterium]|nr:hypothetical protein [Flavobacteriaceae bacterium]MDB4269996.1 hypothetical protein [Flavobacteriaceae bacterium]MDC1543222.1 hypothetical protein [Flavobacteriaceae bacterium]